MDPHLLGHSGGNHRHCDYPLVLGYTLVAKKEIGKLLISRVDGGAVLCVL